MTELEKKLMAMSPAERKKAVEHISGQMGMPLTGKRKPARKTTKKTTKKK